VRRLGGLRRTGRPPGCLRPSSQGRAGGRGSCPAARGAGRKGIGGERGARPARGYARIGDRRLCPWTAGAAGGERNERIDTAVAEQDPRLRAGPRAWAGEQGGPGPLCGPRHRSEEPLLEHRGRPGGPGPPPGRRARHSPPEPAGARFPGQDGQGGRAAGRYRATAHRDKIPGAGRRGGAGGRDRIATGGDRRAGSGDTGAGGDRGACAECFRGRAPWTGRGPTG
jgi:hypothetical protein